MNSEEYRWAIDQAKAMRRARANNLADPAARLQFEQDFAEPLDDARDHMPPRSEHSFSKTEQKKAG